MAISCSRCVCNAGGINKGENWCNGFCYWGNNECKGDGKITFLLLMHCKGILLTNGVILFQWTANGDNGQDGDLVQQHVGEVLKLPRG